MRPTRSRQEGYTLTEALVVIAIIGMVSLIVVPNFIAMYRGAKVKGAVMQFTNDVRAARQRAATTYRPTMISIGTSTTEKYSYWTYRWNGTAWAEETRRDLEPQTSAGQKTVYFIVPNDGYEDSNSDSRRDIIFETNGGVRTTPTNPAVRIRTDQPVGKPLYTITINTSGSVQAE